ncbi:MAG: DUF1788 domain-containing protein [Gammaproteobacteria bacterium]|nr:DUF1788 domain-containing protein [Gammaproteobacteria bacterium]MCY4313019.1 DUF1788 domain-containing protein [Gammaproteobacteria bacterium]
MKLNAAIKPNKEMLEQLVKVISSNRFLNKQGLGNEVPFFICPFQPEDANQVARLRQQLTSRLEKKGVQILEIDLYDLSMEILIKRNVWNRVIELEHSISKDQLKEFLQGILAPEEHLVPAIASKITNEEFDVLFLTGVGEVFPYIRSHNVLNNLQSTAKNQPTVVFFPGSYTHVPDSGTSLELFGKLRDDKYYRAFNIFQFEV